MNVFVSTFSYTVVLLSASFIAFRFNGDINCMDQTDLFNDIKLSCITNLYVAVSVLRFKQPDRLEQ